MKIITVWYLMPMTYSHLSNMGKPIDIIVLMGVDGAGAIGMAILVYTAETLIGSDPTKSDCGE